MKRGYAVFAMKGRSDRLFFTRPFDTIDLAVKWLRKNQKKLALKRAYIRGYRVISGTGNKENR